ARFCLCPVCVARFCLRPVCVARSCLCPVCVARFCLRPVCVARFCLRPVCVARFCLRLVCVAEQQIVRIPQTPPSSQGLPLGSTSLDRQHQSRRNKLVDAKAKRWHDDPGVDRPSVNVTRHPAAFTISNSAPLRSTRFG